MTVIQIVLSLLFFLVATILFIYCNKTRKKEGTLYSSLYLYLDDDKKEHFDKNKEYRNVTILLAMIALFFLGVSIAILTLNKTFVYFALLCLACALVFSIYRVIDYNKKH